MVKKKPAPKRTAAKKVAITPEKVINLLRTIMDPELGSDLVSLGFIEDVSVERGKAIVRFHLSDPFSPLGQFFGVEIRRVLLKNKIPSQAFITDHKKKDTINAYVNWVKFD